MRSRPAVLYASALCIASLLCGCNGARAGTQRAASGAVTRDSSPATSVSASAGLEGSPSAQAVCKILADSGALNSAGGFVIVAGVVKPGDVDGTIDTLHQAQDVAPTEFQQALYNIVLALQGIGELASGMRSGSVDTSAVGPDARLLAGMCRARGLPVPAAPAG